MTNPYEQFWADYELIIKDYTKRGGSKKDAIQIARMSVSRKYKIITVRELKK